MGMTKKKLIVFTGARSEFGIAKPLINLLLQQEEFDTKLAVAGGHLLQSQGYTLTEIESSKIPIAVKIEHMIETGDASDVSVTNGKLQIEFAKFLRDYKPDMVIVLGDRSELIPIVSSCLFQSIPVAHISGGEVTEGATDNQVRHAVTKMSHLHFTSTEIYKNNIIRMGEEPWRICVSGEPGLDDILSTPLPSKEDFFHNFNLPFQREIAISTFHSETIGQHINGTFLTELIHTLCNRTDFHFLFTAANTDVGGHDINETLRQISIHNSRVTFVQSLGRLNYFAALKYASVMIGNSSSGLVEAHSFGIPVINVGSRQDGRLRNFNVIDVPSSVQAIIEAIPRATNPKFRASIQGIPNIYGDGNACNSIVTFLKQVDWDRLLLKQSTF
jgi:GDP/UDP-N,N'-diacetylbacillosamine 2-epimerase (hydrolysing)